MKTRMVQLPATAVIEYVAAGHFFPGGLLPGSTFVRGDFWPGDFCQGVLLSGGSFARGDFCPGAYARSPNFNAYTHRLGFLCLAS